MKDVKKNCLSSKPIREERKKYWTVQFLSSRDKGSGGISSNKRNTKEKDMGLEPPFVERLLNML